MFFEIPNDLIPGRCHNLFTGYRVVEIPGSDQIFACPKIFLLRPNHFLLYDTKYRKDDNLVPFNFFADSCGFSELLINCVINAYISHAQSLENRKKILAISKCVLRASNRGGKKHKQQQEKQLLSRLERWKSGDYAALWYEAASMKQSNKTSNESIDALASSAKSLCLQGQFERAAKVLSSEGVATDNAATLNELKKHHSKEKQPDHQFYSEANTNAYQFDEALVFFQIESFSKFTATGPSKLYPERLQHAVNCGAPNQSKRAIQKLLIY